MKIVALLLRYFFVCLSISLTCLGNGIKTIAMLEINYDSWGQFRGASIEHGEDIFCVGRKCQSYNRCDLLEDYISLVDHKKRDKLRDAIYNSLNALGEYCTKMTPQEKCWNIFWYNRKIMSKSWELKWANDKQVEELTLKTFADDGKTLISTENFSDDEFKDSAKIIYQDGCLEIAKLNHKLLKSFSHQRTRSEEL